MFNPFDVLVCESTGVAHGATADNRSRRRVSDVYESTNVFTSGPIKEHY